MPGRRRPVARPHGPCARSRPSRSRHYDRHGTSSAHDLVQADLPRRGRRGHRPGRRRTERVLESVDGRAALGAEAVRPFIVHLAARSPVLRRLGPTRPDRHRRRPDRPMCADWDPAVDKAREARPLPLAPDRLAYVDRSSTCRSGWPSPTPPRRRLRPVDPGLAPAGADLEHRYVEPPRMASASTSRPTDGRRSRWHAGGAVACSSRTPHLTGRQPSRPTAAGLHRAVRPPTAPSAGG